MSMFKKTKTAKKVEVKSVPEKKQEKPILPKVDEKPVRTPVPVQEIRHREPEPEILYKIYIPCPECRTDVKGKLLNCNECHNTRKQLKEWAEK